VDPCPLSSLKHDDPVCVAYNLFSLEADNVTYDAKNKTIKATGDVVVVNESGVTQPADSTTFKIENGHAMPIQ
jgi:lipopolysaccharide assembly outer membrane protein LptD (OstA)